MADAPSGVIVQQYEHRSVRESIDAAYLETVTAAVELQNYLDDPRGNPVLKFRAFYRAFARLYALTSHVKEIAADPTMKEGLREKIKTWAMPRPDGDPRFIKSRSIGGLDLWDEYHGILVSAGTISTH